MEDIDLDRLRADTPSCERRLHLNNAGASPSPVPIMRAVVAHLEAEAELGGYAAEEAAADRLGAVYTSIGRLICAQPGDIAFTESATHAWRAAFHSILWKAGDRILTSRSDYASNFLEYMRAVERFGVKVETIANDESGALDVDSLVRAIDERVKLVAVTHAPAHRAIVQPVEAIGQVLKGSDVLYLVDACQSVGQMPVDVGAIGCHLLSATGRKFLRGPRGTGFLYASTAVLDRLQPPFIDLHSADWVSEHRYRWAPGARRFESWETPVAGKLGLGAAIDYALDVGLAAVARRVRVLANRVRGRLACIPSVEVMDRGHHGSAIVTFRPRLGPAPALAMALEHAKVSVTCLSRASALVDFQDRQIDAVIRVSPHYFNTESEIDTFGDLVEGLVGAQLEGAA